MKSSSSDDDGVLQCAVNGDALKQLVDSVDRTSEDVSLVITASSKLIDDSTDGTRAVEGQLTIIFVGANIGLHSVSCTLRGCAVDKLVECCDVSEYVLILQRNITSACLKLLGKFGSHDSITISIDDCDLRISYKEDSRTCEMSCKLSDECEDAYGQVEGGYSSLSTNPVNMAALKFDSSVLLDICAGMKEKLGCFKTTTHGGDVIPLMLSIWIPSECVDVETDRSKRMRFSGGGGGGGGGDDDGMSCDGAREEKTGGDDSDSDTEDGKSFAVLVSFTLKSPECGVKIDEKVMMRAKNVYDMRYDKDSPQTLTQFSKVPMCMSETGYVKMVEVPFIPDSLIKYLTSTAGSSVIMSIPIAKDYSTIAQGFVVSNELSNGNWKSPAPKVRSTLLTPFTSLPSSCSDETIRAFRTHTSPNPYIPEVRIHLKGNPVKRHSELEEFIKDLLKKMV